MPLGVWLVMRPIPAIRTFIGITSLSLFSFACSTAQEPDPATGFPTEKPTLDLRRKGTYAEAKNGLVQLRNECLERLNSATTDSARNAVVEEAGKLLTEQFVFGIFPHWMGTTWAFEGHTDIPGTGEVACGYFVSTTLKHGGFNLNRYKLAQQAAYTGCKSLNMGKKPEHIAGMTAPEAVTWFLSNKPDGLYTVGLDFHVGFLYKVSGQLYFIHSSYLPPVAVTVENAATSAAFSASKSWWITPITHNGPLITAWLKGDMILISP
jgi:hypothetical protein